MPRPVLIVGIGGTGQWVLTWLKRDLVEIYGQDHVPPQIQLLAFDTTTTTEASATAQTAQSGKDKRTEEPARIGDIVLEPQKEFVHLGGDAYDFARAIRDGDERYAHIAQWFEAKFWLEKLPPSAFKLEEGAGRIRPLGRLALFLDMLVNGGRGIVNPLRTKLMDVRDAARGQGGKINIVVTGSFAGGTGSGLFLDITLLLHKLAEELDIDYTMFGFFALPWAFTPRPDDEMLARSFAAWRELNRFMVVREDFTMPPVVYDPSSARGWVQPRRRLFDYVYLVDGRLRNGQTLGVEASYGVHPAIATAIYTLIVDQHAASAYTEKIVTNLHPIFARNPGKPMYSTFGVKSLKIPAHYLQERAVLELGYWVLEKVLSPEERVRWFTEVLLEDQGWLLRVATPNRNPEDPGVAGRERAPQIFAHSVQYGGLIGKPTRFIARLGDLLEKSREARQQVVESLARAVLGRHGQGGWAAYFPDLGDDPGYQKLREAVREHVRFSVRKSYDRRKGEKGPAVRRRMRDLPEEVRRRFGTTTLQGPSAEEFQGEFGEVLQKVRIAQTDVFRHLLRLQLMRILNGTDADPLKARTGKLGYAWDYLDGVVDALDRLIALMDEVWKYREEKVRPEIRVAERLERARRRLEATANKPLCFLLPFVEHPDVRRAEVQYLRAWQEWIDARREDLMHRAVQGTLRDMREVAAAARERVRDWIVHLSTGDPAAGVAGLWQQMDQRERLLAEVAGYDRRLSKIQMLLEDEDALRRIREAEEVLRELLRRLQWEVGVDLKIRQKWLPRLEEEEPVALEDPFLERELSWREEVSHGNFRRFQAYMTPFAPQVVEEANIAERIKREFGREQSAVKAFVDAYHLGRVDVLARVEGAPEKESTLLAVQTAENDPFFYGEHGLEGEIRARHNLRAGKIEDAHPIMAVNLENPYRFIAVHTEELHPLEHYMAWEESARKYTAHIQDEQHELHPVRLHIFGAEVLAADLERRLVLKQGRRYKALSPRVVLLLENRKRFRLFLWMWALGHIWESGREERMYRWEFELPDGAHPRIWLTPGWDPDHAERRPKPTILDAAHGFVIHGETYAPTESWRLRYDEIERWLQAHWSGRGEERVTFLRKQSDPEQEGSIAHRLKTWMEQSEDPTRREEYESLLQVLQLLFADEIAWWTQT